LQVLGQLGAQVVGLTGGEALGQHAQRRMNERLGLVAGAAATGLHGRHEVVVLHCSSSRSF
jgi:hypothetical protein